METKKKIEGAELSFALSPIQALRDYFGAKEYHPQPIRLHSEEYREFRKKIVSAGRLTQWKSVQSGIEKEQVGLKRISERQKRSLW